MVIGDLMTHVGPADAPAVDQRDHRAEFPQQVISGAIQQRHLMLDREMAHGVAVPWEHHAAKGLDAVRAGLLLHPVLRPPIVDNAYTNCFRRYYRCPLDLSTYIIQSVSGRS